MWYVAYAVYYLQPHQFVTGRLLRSETTLAEGVLEALQEIPELNAGYPGKAHEDFLSPITITRLQTNRASCLVAAAISLIDGALGLTWVTRRLSSIFFLADTRLYSARLLSEEYLESKDKTQLL